jgi:hypothetical protein
VWARTRSLSLTGLDWSLLGRRIVIFVMILLTMLMDPCMMLVAQADPTSPRSEVAEGVFGEGFGGGSRAGYIQPDSKTGAMTWSYPFMLPAARGGPQPQLA